MNIHWLGKVKSHISLKCQCYMCTPKSEHNCSTFPDYFYISEDLKISRHGIITNIQHQNFKSKKKGRIVRNSYFKRYSAKKISALSFVYQSHNKIQLFVYRCTIKRKWSLTKHFLLICCLTKHCFLICLLTKHLLSICSFTKTFA